MFGQTLFASLATERHVGRKMFDSLAGALQHSYVALCQVKRGYHENEKLS